jgi:glucose-6-phosphate 1-dehydrogenase
MYLICRGEVEVLDGHGRLLNTLKDGGFFGEIGVLMSTPRTASVRAKTLCDLFVLEKSEFSRILREQPKFAEKVMKSAKERYNVLLAADQLVAKS